MLNILRIGTTCNENEVDFMPGVSIKNCLSPRNKPAYDLLVGCHVIKLYIPVLYIYIYTYIYNTQTHTHTYMYVVMLRIWKNEVRVEC